MDTSPYATRDQILELARLYETVATLDVPPSPPGGHAKPGSRVPPGVQDVLDDDETTRALEAVADWAGFCVHLLLDERPDDMPATIPDEAPARLRIVAGVANVLHFLDHDDELLAVAFLDDLRDNLGQMRRLARRGARPVRTRSACMDITCRGQYVAHPHGTEATEDLVCSACGDRVPWDTWHKWGARNDWVTVEHAMRMLGVETKMAVYQRAKREGWRRQGEGREVRYHRDDVQQRVEGMMSA